MIEIIGWAFIVGLSLATLYLGLRYFVWSIRNHAIARLDLALLEQRVFRCAENEYWSLSWGLQLAPNQAKLFARAIKMMPMEMKRDIVEDRVSFISAVQRLSVPYDNTIVMDREAQSEVRGETPRSSAFPALSLCKAASSGDQECLRACLRDGAPVNEMQDDGTTALWWACHRNNTDIAGMLLEAGANPSIGDGLCRSPLMWAAELGNTSLVKMLLQAGASANGADCKYGTSPLRWAASNGHTEVVELLVCAGADVDHQDTSGWTPLHFAAGGNHLAVADSLVRHGANVNALDRTSRASPLHHAALKGHRQMMLWLQDRGADPGIRSRFHNLTADEMYDLKRRQDPSESRSQS
jgi:ankyrin repeat protein